MTKEQFEAELIPLLKRRCETHRKYQGRGPVPKSHDFCVGCIESRAAWIQSGNYYVDCACGCRWRRFGAIDNEVIDSHASGRTGCAVTYHVEVTTIEPARDREGVSR